MRINVSKWNKNVRQKTKTHFRHLKNKYMCVLKRSCKKHFHRRKLFTFEITQNQQNDRVYGSRKKDILVSRLHHQYSCVSKKIMVSAGVIAGNCKKTDFHFIDTKTRVKENYSILIEMDYFLIAIDIIWEINTFFTRIELPSIQAMPPEVI